MHHNYLEGLLTVSWSHHRISDSLGLGYSLKIRISKKSSCDADVPHFGMNVSALRTTAVALLSVDLVFTYCS